SAAGLLAQREKIQKEIQNLENVLGPIHVSDDNESSSEESELGLSPSVDSCLQMNLVYQQVVKETLDQLETLLAQNHRHQKELLSQLSGPMKGSTREQSAPSSCQQPISMFLGRFLKPYFKDKLTGLGPPANQEAKEKASRMTGSLDDRKLRVKRCENHIRTTPEPHKNHIRTTSEPHQNHTRTTQEPHQNHIRTTPEPHQNHTRTTPEPHPNYTRTTSELHQNYIRTTTELHKNYS
ncbi:snRNA-activating protein complex subunit 4-like, partial [Etheostoma cragini]|uniref:snRNA-activating protein complex subunit 4-like n=1 Tax=Etheostoma cragini TaxID=417921 RepID=UPI00155E51A1